MNAACRAFIKQEIWKVSCWDSGTSAPSNRLSSKECVSKASKLSWGCCRRLCTLMSLALILSGNHRSWTSLPQAALSMGAQRKNHSLKLPWSKGTGKNRAAWPHLRLGQGRRWRYSRESSGTKPDDISYPGTCIVMFLVLPFIFFPRWHQVTHNVRKKRGQFCPVGYMWRYLRLSGRVLLVLVARDQECSSVDW